MVVTMKKALTPFNLELLIPTDELVKGLGEVTNHEIFEGVGGSFHDDGLFSTIIFGRVGSQERESNFGYINLGLEIIHPVIYRNLIRLRAFYEEIIMGRAYAVFSDKEKDFVASNELEGSTGYHFFFSNWKRIAFGETKSPIRANRLALIDKYRDRSTFSNMVISPAAYREVEIDFNGRVEMNDINEHYRHLLTLARNRPERVLDESELSIYDRGRLGMQQTVLAIYAHYEKLLFGKKGFIQSKWVARRVYNGTRGVLSALDLGTFDLDTDNRPKFKDAVTGINQTAVGNKHKTIYWIREKFINPVFDTLSNTVRLINPKTLALEWVELSNEDLDLWGTIEGNERLINELQSITKRSRAITINDYYLALVYLGNDNTFKVFRDITELPEGFDRKLVRPITYSELIYLSLIEFQHDLAGFVTRYPVENYNSSFPVQFYIKTTIVGDIRKPLNDNWEVDESLPVAYEYPRFTLNEPANWHDSISLSAPMLGPLGGDQYRTTLSNVL